MTDVQVEQITALDAKFAAQAADLRAMRTGAPSAPASLPPLRPERAVLWCIAMLCQAALPAQVHPYFLQIARVCREVVQREDGQ